MITAFLVHSTNPPTLSSNARIAILERDFGLDSHVYSLLLRFTSVSIIERFSPTDHLAYIPSIRSRAAIQTLETRPNRSDQFHQDKDHKVPFDPYP